MPHVRKGRVVYKKVNGLKKKGKAKSVAKAKRYKRLLEAVHHTSWRPTGRSGSSTQKYSSAWKGGKKRK